MAAAVAALIVGLASPFPFALLFPEVRMSPKTLAVVAAAVLAAMVVDHFVGVSKLLA